MAAAFLNPSSLANPLRDCGYYADLLRADFLFGDGQTVPLVGFAQAPLDSRSACIAVLSTEVAPQIAVESYRDLGAPLAFVCFKDTLQWWKQGARSAEYIESVPAEGVHRFFQEHREAFSPKAIYRAKTWGRFRPEYQLSFVDLGLMPLVEEEIGQSLGTLIEGNVAELKSELAWNDITEEQGQWLLEAIFWLVSAKILRDKQVETFANLSLIDISAVFDRLSQHYGIRPLVVKSAEETQALRRSASNIERFSSLALTTTESLAYVYENTLISKETRASLGTHSTPQYLVDYVLGNLVDWIADIPMKARNVFEPACGHGAFLVSAMRLLTDLLSEDERRPNRRAPYLRSRLHGIDIDAFALDLARLSLTLADIPNPNGWDLKPQDMFIGEVLRQQIRDKTILLANPPFENFQAQGRSVDLRKESHFRFFNKTAEMLWRTLPELPEGGVFGIVVPQSFLRSTNGQEVREFILRNCELREICLFPDKVFSFSDAESAVLIGRRNGVNRPHSVRYRCVRERDIALFRSEYVTSSTRAVLQSEFFGAKELSFQFPDLQEVWNTLRDNPTLADVATVGKGLTYRGKDLSAGSFTFSEQPFQGSYPGFVRFKRNLFLHQLPKRYWMNLDASVISAPRSGNTIEVPQVLLNYAPTSRGPWRLKALIDCEGHAVSSRFIAVRPCVEAYSLQVLWALLNSPIANAYAFTHASKRDNLVGDIRKIPLPRAGSLKSVEDAVTDYFAATPSGADLTVLMRLLLRVDYEVLKLYSLPADIEQQLLAIFNDWTRVGVPFAQTRYVPAELENRLNFSNFFDFERDWSATNRERGMLIDKKVYGAISSEERLRLNALQTYAEYHINQVAPRPTDVLDELEKRVFSR